ncbi:phosphomethylpyrimidine kinase [Kwoniella sp. DSM 27419]
MSVDHCRRDGPEVSLEPSRYPVILTVAGSDSGGGAGIQADLKTIEAFACYGASVLTGLTAQNTQGVQAVHEVPTRFVMQQLDSVLSDTFPDVIKIGMLTNASIITALADKLRKLESRAITVLDPVMISTSGHTLLPSDAIEALRDLYPLVDYFTPNIPEAIKVSGDAWHGKSDDLDLADLLELAMATNKATGARMVLLKGGHASVTRDQVLAYKGKYQIVWEEGDDEAETAEVLALYDQHLDLAGNKDLVVDTLVDQGQVVALFVGRKVNSTSTHGTGCTLSTAIACSHAIEAVRASGSTASADRTIRTFRRAIAYTQSAIASAYPFGSGHGPLNHGHLTVRRALPPPTKHNPRPFTSHLIHSNLPLWKSYVRHPFVVQLGKGTLPRECFEHYIKQDYHYLKHYARAHALGAYKADSFADIKAFTDIAAHIARESQMHVDYCAQFGISLEQLRAEPEASPCAAYARYVVDIGTQGDLLDLYMAVASCLIGYGEVGLWLKRQVEKGEAVLEGNVYRKWMEDYAGQDFLTAVNLGIDNLERRIALDPPTEERLARLTKIWHECVRLESAFWEMGLKLIK